MDTLQTRKYRAIIDLTFNHFLPFRTFEKLYIRLLSDFLSATKVNKISFLFSISYANSNWPKANICLKLFQVFHPTTTKHHRITSNEQPKYQSALESDSLWFFLQRKIQLKKCCPVAQPQHVFTCKLSKYHTTKPQTKSNF